jgi:hypothetical protein
MVRLDPSRLIVLLPANRPASVGGVSQSFSFEGFDRWMVSPLSMP